ncbi:hypothetical protein [uncultured Paludibaculum sp.]|uniref:hypothetical protein n=1 Tax=uncultured Paludibaculum sp. TaxID=1765020 RepID=UPI002AAB64ED|nr:hypothetical protein [uncultured Paludibaculum sp.]
MRNHGPADQFGPIQPVERGLERRGIRTKDMEIQVNVSPRRQLRAVEVVAAQDEGPGPIT